MNNNLVLIELYLLESYIQYSKHNLTKAKSAIISCYAISNKFYIKPYFKAKINIQSGIFAIEEKKYNISYSYFYEAFEIYRILKDFNHSEKALIYLLLSNILNKKFKDFENLINNKDSLNFCTMKIKRMYAIYKAFRLRSIKKLEIVLKTFKQFEDNLIESKILSLKKILEEENLINFFEPYNRIKINYIAKIINLSNIYVRKRIKKMIVDNKLNGIIDEVSNTVIMNSTYHENDFIKLAKEIFNYLENVIEILIKRFL